MERNNLEKMLIAEISQLEILSKVYSDFLGNDAVEVKNLDKKIHELNAELLQFMVEEEG